MTEAMVEKNQSSGHLGRSIIALVVGFFVTIILTIPTDLALHAIGLFPALGQPATDGPLALATTYRTIYGIIGSYVVARLAPNRPMLHALIGGAIGLVISIVGAAVTWNKDMGPHWYPVALAVLALPTAWVGGKIRENQLAK